MSDEAPEKPIRRGPPWVAATVGLLTIAGAVLVFVISRHARAGSGHVIAAERTTVRLGGRGVAVVEPGVELDWTVSSGGAASVQQRSGKVFYRVEPRGPFVVTTPAGEIRDRGTCFTAELGPDALVVTVYEGQVLLVDPRGQIELSAGERGQAQGGNVVRLP